MKLLLITIAAVCLMGCGNPEANRALLKAVSDENIDAMKAAIANGADINAKDKGGATPLDYTLIKNNRLKYLQIPKDNKTNILNQNIANLLLKHGGESGTPDSLVVAALVGDISWVSKHLDNGISVNNNIDNRFTPLLVAAKEGHIKIAELLIAQGADVDLKLPIIGAIKRKQIEIVETLIANSANINLKDSDGRTPLHFAARKGFKKIAALLITKGANVNEKDNRTTTPLHEAAGWGHKEFVALLLANGANINVKRRSGGTPTPLDHVEGAIKQYSHRSNYSPEKIAALKETAEFLRKNGGKTSDGLKADESIYLAAKLGDIEAVQKHMNNGVDVNAKGEGRWTPLFNAVYWAIDQLPTGHKEIVELLLAKGADVNAKSELGETPLHFAKTKEIVELLIAEGADVNAKDEDGGTPLDNASPEIVDLLRKHGGKHGRVYCAAEGGDVEAVKEFLAAGADVNGMAVNNQTPLHSAADGGHTEVAELLIANGADVNAKDYDDKTPLDRADDEIADLLRKHGGKTFQELFKLELKAEGK